MSIQISQQNEALLTEEAQRQGISIDALLERLISQRRPSAGEESLEVPELPVLHLGPMGPLHRRDIYNDAG